uniref:Uncharacterized protein n=1 Tax=Arundo donax TaxID=35708 RepID=A0A0A9GUI0_ARUDO
MNSNRRRPRPTGTPSPPGDTPAEATSFLPTLASEEKVTSKPLAAMRLARRSMGFTCPCPGKQINSRCGGALAAAAAAAIAASSPMDEC